MLRVLWLGGIFGWIQNPLVVRKKKKKKKKKAPQIISQKSVNSNSNI
jgi:hypothetical protein